MCIRDRFNIVGLSARPPHTQKQTKKGKKPLKRPKPVLDESRYSYVGDQSSFSQVLLGEMCVEDRKVIKEVQAEMDRANHTDFSCVFPTRHSVSYAPYFDGPRPLNALLARLLWSESGVDLTSARAKVIARNGIVPFWKDESPARMQRSWHLPREKREANSASTVAELVRGSLRSARTASPRGVGKRGSKAGISSLLTRFQSLPSSREVKEMWESEKEEQNSDRLPSVTGSEKEERLPTLNDTFEDSPEAPWVQRGGPWVANDPL
eukprot:TRINITY_DN18359_c0_g1_i4.p1 TRINITY_DN18359_c0_g1~~TRINITY_DN18359_c0_g1_i4.p1  ORF type:complete len:265 (+),score=18.44 TRINITY_DN18359_c0_g1_i4:143-937(+)